MLFVCAWILAVTKNAPFNRQPIRATDLQDYGGGSNTILIWITFFLLIFIITGAITWFLYQHWRYNQFFSICRERDLSIEECGLIASFAKRFHEKDLLNLVTKRSHFDRLISRIAHSQESQRLSMAKIQKENLMIQKIRHTLGFNHSYSEPKLQSTRCLPINQPVTILLTNHKKERSSLKFLSTIIHNDNLFIGVTPPDNQERLLLSEKEKLPLIVSFVRENDAEYLFETVLSSVITTPKELWILRHSSTLTKGSSHKKLALHGLLSIADDQTKSSIDHKIVIDHLSREGCQFHFKQEFERKLPPFTALLSLTYKESREVFSAQIIDTVQRGNLLFYRAQFNQVEKEQLFRLQRIIHTLREKPNAKKSLSQASLNKQVHR